MPTHTLTTPAVINASSSRGFTLVEVLIVAAILSIASLVVSLNLQTGAPHKIELAIAEIAQSIRFAQNEARRTAIPYGVHIEADELRVRVMRDTNAAIPPVPTYDVYNPISKQLYQLDLARALSATSTTLTPNASWIGTCTDSTRVFFDTQGRPRCGSDWSVLLSEATIKLDWSDHTRSIKVDGETGRVTTL